MSLPTSLSCRPAPSEAIYPDIPTALAAIQAHAKANGYAFFRRDGKPKRVVFVCDRAGKYDPKSKHPNTHTSKQRAKTGTKKCDCQMRIALSLDDISGSWKLKVLEAIHNHGQSADPAAHPAHRIASTRPEIRAQIDSYAKAGLSTAQILTLLRQDLPGVLLSQKDISNIVQLYRLDQLNGKTPIQWLMEVCIKQSIFLYFTNNVVGTTNQWFLSSVLSFLWAFTSTLFH
jgi:hypothetical protein